MGYHFLGTNPCRQFQDLVEWTIYKKTFSGVTLCSSVALWFVFAWIHWVHTVPVVDVHDDLFRSHTTNPTRWLVYLWWFEIVSSVALGSLTHLDLFLNFRGWFKEQDDSGKRCSHGGIRLERQEIYGVPVPETAAFSEELLLGRLESWRVLWDGEGKSVEKPKRLTGFYGEKCRPLCNSRADGTCNGAEICRLLA